MDNNQSNQENEPSKTKSSSAFFYFAMFTLIYAIAKYKSTDENGMVISAIYFFVLLFTQFFINVAIVKEICGEAQFGTALMVTGFPWLMIFGILNLMLIYFPGWLTPFSNTFGYLIVKLGGISSFMNNLLAEKATGEALRAVRNIYANKSLFINQVPYESFNVFYNGFYSKMMEGNIFVDEKNPKRNEANAKKLHQFVRLKNIAAEFLWLLLAGNLVTSISSNYIVNTGCKRSVGAMQRRQSAHDQQTKDKADEVVYKSRR